MLNWKAKMNITVKQWSTARYKIKKHYDLKREVTDDEVKAEIAMIKRHFDNDTMDLNIDRLWASLSTGKDAIDFDNI